MSKRKIERPAAAPAAATVVYIGPTIRGRLMTGTIYRDGLPEAEAAFVTEHPVLRRLVVPIEDLAAARAEIRHPGAALAVLYEKALHL